MADKTDQAPILSTSNNMLFEDREEVTFPDGTEANLDGIAIRSLRLRPQRSKQGELWCVLTASFLVDSVIASKGDKVHLLCDTDNPYGKAYQNETLKRVEVERWVPWNRVPSLRPLLRQLQTGDYDVESNKHSYRQVTEWFAKNDKATTMSPESTWMDFSVKRDGTPLPASFIAGFSEMQEGTTKSIYEGLDQIKTLIDEFTAAHKAGEITRELNSEFRGVVGSLLGFHKTNKGAKWGNKLQLVALTVEGEEYSLYFDRNRESVSDVDDLFDDESPDTLTPVDKEEEPIDIGAILSGADIDE